MTAISTKFLIIYIKNFNISALLDQDPWSINPKLYPATLLQDNKILQTTIINLKLNSFNNCSHMDVTFCRYCYSEFNTFNKFNTKRYFLYCPTSSPPFLPIVNSIPDFNVDTDGCSFFLAGFQDPNISKAILNFSPKIFCKNNHSIYFKHFIIFFIKQKQALPYIIY